MVPEKRLFAAFPQRKTPAPRRSGVPLAQSFPKVRRELETSQYNELLGNRLLVVSALLECLADRFHELGKHLYLGVAEFGLIFSGPINKEPDLFNLLTLDAKSIK